jgi:hypothetical protein
MYVSLSPIPVVTRLGGGNGRQPERQTAATRSKMKASSEEWRIGRLCRKAGCERMGAQVRNCHLHRSRALENLKLPMAQGQNTVLVKHLRSGGGGEKSSDCRDHRGRLDPSGNAGCVRQSWAIAVATEGKTCQLCPSEHSPGIEHLHRPRARSELHASQGRTIDPLGPMLGSCFVSNSSSIYV